MGQLGYFGSGDPRAALNFHNTLVSADESTGRGKSYVTGCSFHSIWNRAIGIWHNVNGIEVTKNIIMGATLNGIKVTSTDVLLEDNLIADIWDIGTMAMLHQTFLRPAQVAGLV